jgi:hypothetical protein
MSLANAEGIFFIEILICILAAGNGVFLLKTAFADGACKSIPR